jgi:hypothetical protein
MPMDPVTGNTYTKHPPNIAISKMVGANNPGAKAWYLCKPIGRDRVALAHWYV